MELTVDPIPEPPSAQVRERVILLHGIARSDRHMARLARRLEEDGFDVLNITYPSRTASISALADHVAERAVAFLEPDCTVHMVGHSMGGLVIRAFLARHRPARLGRVVMLGTPNHGSEVADLLSRNAAYRWFYGPAGQELVTAEGLKPHISDIVDYDLGIIAGTRSIDPLSSLLIGRRNDGKVSVESTRLVGMKEHLVLPVTHTFMPQNRVVMAAVANFLRNGSFG